jgi:hypothetical protein
VSTIVGFAGSGAFAQVVKNEFVVLKGEKQ